MFEYKSEKSVIDFSAKEHSKTLGRLKVVEDFEWQVAVESQGNPGYKEYITKIKKPPAMSPPLSVILDIRST